MNPRTALTAGAMIATAVLMCLPHAYAASTTQSAKPDQATTVAAAKTAAAQPSKTDKAKAEKPKTEKAKDDKAKPSAAKPAGKSAASKSTTKPAAGKSTGDKPAAKSAAKSASPDKATAAKKAAAPKEPASKAAGKPAAKASPAKAPTPSTPTPRHRPKATARSDGHPTPRRPAAHAAPARSAPLATAATTVTPTDDQQAVKQVIAVMRKGRTEDANAAQATIRDPLARKLAEWIILRSDDNNVGFARYNAFIAENPGWPSVVTLRRRAEAMLWQERAPPATVRAFFANTEPLSTKGHFALARALMAEGDRAGAQAQVRDAWRNDAFSADLEAVALELFHDLISRADDKARMEKRLYVDDTAAALRAAERLGGHEPAIARARAAVNAKSAKARALLDAVPESLRHQPGYLFSHTQWLRRNDRIAEAGAHLVAAPRDPAVLHDLDEWWIERRLTARKLLDIGDARTAYRVVRDAVPPTKDNYRIEHEFTAGWIALRFLRDPATAARHFGRIGDYATNPISLARAGYWQGRAAEAAGRTNEARAFYQTAARYPTAYYGQLARARLGLGEITLSRPPAPASRLEVVRAAEILYAIGERDVLVPFMADVPDKSDDVGALAALAELAVRHGDTRSVLLVGKTALGRGLPLDHYAFPTAGLPRYRPIGTDVESAIVYSIARQESAFNPRIVSSANAMGLMQVTPAAGKYIAKKFKIAYDQKRLLNDSVYNMQMGAAEIGDVIERYRGSYILAFAAYNAGSGRVREWIERYGDPRDPQIDAIDWVERIPFSETRNYVQRVMENLQVYRTRFGGSPRLLIEADLHRGTAAN